jgi:hypothetical protein
MSDLIKLRKATEKFSAHHRGEVAMIKRNMTGRQITGSLTVYDDGMPIGYLSVTDDNRLMAIGGGDLERSFGFFDSIQAAAKALPKVKAPAAV